MNKEQKMSGWQKRRTIDQLQQPSDPESDSSFNWGYLMTKFKARKKENTRKLNAEDETSSGFMSDAAAHDGSTEIPYDDLLTNADWSYTKEDDLPNIRAAVTADATEAATATAANKLETNNKESFPKIPAPIILMVDATGAAIATAAINEDGFPKIPDAVTVDATEAATATAPINEDGFPKIPAAVTVDATEAATATAAIPADAAAKNADADNVETEDTDNDDTTQSDDEPALQIPSSCTGHHPLVVKLAYIDGTKNEITAQSDDESSLQVPSSCTGHYPLIAKLAYIDGNNNEKILKVITKDKYIQSLYDAAEIEPPPKPPPPLLQPQQHTLVKKQKKCLIKKRTQHLIKKRDKTPSPDF